MSHGLPPPPNRKPTSEYAHQDIELLSVGSLVMALMAWVVPVGSCLFAPFAVVLGVVGLLRINQGKGRFKGVPIAMIGIVAGIGSLAFGWIAIARFFTGLAAPAPASNPAPTIMMPEPPTFPGMASPAPPRPTGKLWVARFVDQPMIVSMPIRRGFVESVTLSKAEPDYNINGEVKFYTQRVSISVKNPKTTPIGPRVSVFLWDSTQTKRAGGRIAHSARADLEPGASKTFDEIVTSEFQPKFFEVVEHD